MRIFFLIFLLAYVGGNVYIFIRALQMLSGFSLAMKILLSVIYLLVSCTWVADWRAATTATNLLG